MWPSRFMEQLPPAPGAKPQRFEFDLQLWLGPVLVPSVAIERAMRMAADRDGEAQGAAPEPRHPGKPGLFATWRKRRHYRQELARLINTCPNMIADIGLTYEAAEAEIARPFWRASPKRGYGVTTIGGEAGEKDAKVQTRALTG